MKVTVPVIVKDPEVTQYEDVAPTEQVEIDEEVFLDGPISSTVAVLDFDPATGALAPGVRFVPPAGAAKGRYELAHPIQGGDGQVDPAAAAVSVFGAVHKTIQMLEEKDALGRRVRWGFPAPHLLVVPRAGEWANACCERESHSLQFFQLRADGGQVTARGSSSPSVRAGRVAPRGTNAAGPRPRHHPATSTVSPTSRAWSARPF